MLPAIEEIIHFLQSVVVVKLLLLIEYTLANTMRLSHSTSFFSHLRFASPHAHSPQRDCSMQ